MSAEQTDLTLWTPERAEYVRPTMAEVNATPLNGLTAVGSFSGCGGSSLGLRMAGWHVKAAIEFIDAAADTYAANQTGLVYRSDIRELEAAQILERLGLERGELDLFEGSPPCASFSMAGSRNRGRTRSRTCETCEGRGKMDTLQGLLICPACSGEGTLEAQAKDYGVTGQKKKQRTDDLFWEWARLLEGLYPRAFVAENVPGMLNGASLENYARRIVSDLNELGYWVNAKIMNAAHYGAPQERRRLIFVGLRRDVAPEMFRFPTPTTPEPFTLGQALESVAPDDPDHAPFIAESSMEGYRLGGLWKRMQERRRNHVGNRLAPTIDASDFDPICETCGKQLDDDRYHEVTQRYNGKPTAAFCLPGRQKSLIGKAYYTMVVPYLDEPCPTLSATGATPGAASCVHPTECRKFTPAEAKAISGFPPDFVLTGSRAERYERIGRAVAPPLYREVGKAIAEALR